jgi:hypothetical protein
MITIVYMKLLVSRQENISFFVKNIILFRKITLTLFFGQSTKLNSEDFGFVSKNLT